MRARSAGGDVVELTGPQVRGGVEADDIGRAGGGDRGVLMRAPGAHLDARPPGRRTGHPSPGGGDGAIVIQHRQHQRLQQHRLAERALDDEHRRHRPVRLAFREAGDVDPGRGRTDAGGEPLGGRVVDHVPFPQHVDLVRAEAEALERVEQPPGAGEHPVAPAFGQPAGEDFENGRLLRDAGGNRGLQHGELVVVGEQCGAAHRRSVRAKCGSCGRGARRTLAWHCPDGTSSRGRCPSGVSGASWNGDDRNS